MFTGIIEKLGKIVAIEAEGTNIHFTIESEISSELKIDQSIAHNGICLTVVSLAEKTHTVTAIAETIEKTTAGRWRLGDWVNLERCVKLGDRMDGHWVQGHVDQVGKLSEIQEVDGSWIFHFTYEGDEHITVPKGSITVNGTSLTVVDSASHFP
jgi:riboflavin synthase